jgi:hypothetical protein
MTFGKLIAGLVLALPLFATAQEVWRCGPDGRTYSSVPCAEGRRVDTPDARPAADVADARQRATEERRTAESLTRERLARESAQRGNGLAGMVARTDELKPVSAKKAQPKPKPARTAKHRPRAAA